MNTKNETALHYRDGRIFTGTHHLNDHKRPYTVNVYPCSRCGGAGGGDKWQFTGWTCFDCGGSGKAQPRTEKLYTADQLAKLDAAQGKRDAKRAVEAAAKLAERQAAAAATAAAFDASRDAERAAAEARHAEWLASRAAQFAALLAVLESEPQGAFETFWQSLARQIRQTGNLSHRQAPYAAKALYGRRVKANAKQFDELAYALRECCTR